MIVVGDASVFIALERIGATEVLPRVYGEVHVPGAVWSEVFSSAARLEAEAAPPWVIQHEVRLTVGPLPWDEALDPGETEAILLAQQLRAGLLLIDETAGRTVARRLGLESTGVIGVLLEAKRRGVIPQVAPCLGRLRVAGFWLSDAVVNHALSLADESTESV